MFAKILADAGLKLRLNHNGGLSVSGLESLGNQAEDLRLIIKQNRDALIQELHAQRPGHSTVAAREFTELCRIGMLRLHKNEQGGFWWAAPGYENDADSLVFVADLWSECFEILFHWRDQGKLKEFLGAKPGAREPPTPSQPIQAAPGQRQLTLSGVTAFY